MMAICQTVELYSWKEMLKAHKAKFESKPPELEVISSIPFIKIKDCNHTLSTDFFLNKLYLEIE